MRTSDSPSDAARIKRQLEEERKQLDEIAERYRKLSKPLFDDLANIGIITESALGVSRKHPSYTKSIDVLIKHFHYDYPARVKVGIANTLASSKARAKAWAPFLQYYRTAPNLSDVAPPGEIGAPSGVKDAVAAALSTMASQRDISEIIELISNPPNGPSRVFFVSTLMRMGSEDASETCAGWQTTRISTRRLHTAWARARRELPAS